MDTSFKKHHTQGLFLSLIALYCFLLFAGLCLLLESPYFFLDVLYVHELPSEVNLCKVSHRVLFWHDSRACWIPVPRISVDAAFLLTSCACLMLR